MLPPQLIERLTNIVGEENLEVHSENQKHQAPGGVVFPSSAGQTGEIVALANRKNVMILPQGSGFRPQAPVHTRKPLVLSTQRLNRVVDLDEKSLKVTLQAGVSLRTLREELARKNLYFPAYPWCFQEATVGGCASNGIGGPASLKHGVFKQYVLGMEVVLPTGEETRIGGQTVKNVVGYDLTSLFCGSEGSLGVITALTLRVLPKPPSQLLLVMAYDAATKACAAMRAMAASGEMPDRMAMLDPWLNGKMDSLINGWPGRNEDTALLVQIEGLPEAVAARSESILKPLKKVGGRLLLKESDSAEADKIWLAQGDLLSSINSAATAIMTWDMVVPVSRSGLMMEKIDRCALEHGIKIIHGGYYGNGVFHPVVLLESEAGGAIQKATAVFRELKRFAVSAGGNGAGPFNQLGIEKAKFMHPVTDRLKQVIRGIKGALDPGGVMKPLSF